MGSLAGFSYRRIIKRLRELGLSFHRQAAGPHEIWFNLANRPECSHAGERRYPFVTQAVTDEAAAKVAGVDAGLRRDDVLNFIRSPVTSSGQARRGCARE